MKNLIKKLTEETIEFKVSLMSRTKDWAEAQYERNIERKNQYYKMKLRETVEQFPSSFSGQKEGVDYFVVSKEVYNREQKFYWNSPSWYFDRDEFVKRTLILAEKKYETGIEKLAGRIVKKGLNADCLKKVSGVYLDPNLNIEISDGQKSVRAWTIIAGGPVQKPHYRYLVK
jgi:hypothetical protein